jgi:hypothetical protein
VHVALRLEDHQVQADGQPGRLADRPHDHRPDGDVRNEPAIHHVDVDPVGAGGFDGLDLAREVAEVGGEDRRRDFEGR